MSLQDLFAARELRDAAVQQVKISTQQLEMYTNRMVKAEAEGDKAKAREAEEKVEKAKQEVREAEEKVREAKQEVAKAEEKVRKTV